MEAEVEGLGQGVAEHYFLVVEEEGLGQGELEHYFLVREVL